jgi:hypothetical protein
MLRQNRGYSSLTKRVHLLAGGHGARINVVVEVGVIAIAIGHELRGFTGQAMPIWGLVPAQPARGCPGRNERPM